MLPDLFPTCILRSDCDVCFLELDHHCPFMGTCVAKNNLYPFYVFNVMWPLLMLYTGLSAAALVGIQLYAYVLETYFQQTDSSNYGGNVTNASTTMSTLSG